MPIVGYGKAYEPVLELKKGEGNSPGSVVVTPQ